MIDFEMSKEQRMVDQMTMGMATGILRKYARQADTDSEVPPNVLSMMIGAGGMSAGGVSRSQGGEGDGVGEVKDKKGVKQQARVSMTAAENMGYGDPAAILAMPGPGLGGPPVQADGTPEQKEKYLGMFAKMKKPMWGAYALTEPGAGTDVARIRTSCRKDGDHYVINGTKCFITNGGRAEWNVVFATLNPELGRAGQRAFIVEKGTPGFTVGKIEKKMGLRASETAELRFEDCRVHKDQLLGGEKRYEEKASKEGFKTAMKTFDSTRPMVAAIAVGIGRAVTDIATEWAKERYDFSRPIPRYRLLEEKLAHMHRTVAAMRALVWDAAYKADMGVPNSKEASMCKAYAGEWAQKLCIEAIDVMGRDGLSTKYLVEKFFRDAKVYDIFEGTNQAQHIVISKRIIDGIKDF